MRGMKIQTALRYHLTSIRSAIINEEVGVGDP